MELVKRLSKLGVAPRLSASSAQHIWLKHRKVILFLTLGLISGVAITLLFPLLKAVPLVTMFAAGLVYLISHILRALRLAFISIDLFGGSGRTVALMHLATTPFSLVLPFKSGELLRFHELWKLSGKAIYGIVGLLIDRMYDSIFLLPLVLLLLGQGNPPSMSVALTFFAAIVPLAVIAIGPRLLADAQLYMVRNHNNPRVLNALRRVDAVRVLVNRAADVTWRRALELSVVSLLIWLCEFLLCLIVVNSFNSDTSSASGDALDLLGARLVTSWWTTSNNPLVQPTLVITTFSIFLIWPVATTFYLSRRNRRSQRMSAQLPTKRRGREV